MKQRYIYTIIFGIPGLMISVIAGVFTSGLTMGAFWLYVYGDGEWPSWPDWVIITTGILAFIIIFVLVIILGYKFGKKRENENIPTDKKHILISFSICILLPVAMFFFDRGYVFTKPSGTVCREMCIEKGYRSEDGTMGTSMTPEVNGKTTCSCWNQKTKQHDEVGIIDYNL